MARSRKTVRRFFRKGGTRRRKAGILRAKTLSGQTFRVADMAV